MKLTPPVELSTQRLILRQWRDSDREPYAALNADPEVMEHFPAPFTPEQSDAHIDLMHQRLAHATHGHWAVEIKRTGEFLGFTGLTEPTFDAAFTPCTEIGWRLRRSAWGHGYATEAATAALDHAFDTLGLGEVVSFTASTNLRSEAVMRRLGMHHDPNDDFDHVRVPTGHRLQRHLLYRISNDEWAARRISR